MRQGGAEWKWEWEWEKFWKEPVCLRGVEMVQMVPMIGGEMTAMAKTQC